MNQLSDTAICLGLPLFSAISLIIMLIALIRLFSKGPRKRSPTLREMVTTMDVDGIVRALSTGDLDRRIVTARNFIRAISGRIGAVGIDWENFISNPRFVEPIIDLLQMLHTMVGWRDHKEIFIRFLGGIGDTRAVEPLVDIVGDSDTNLRSLAIVALGEIGDARAVGPLLSHLSIQDIDCIISGVALSKMGWQPHTSDETAVAYWMANQEWEKCARKGAVALKPLIAGLTSYTTSYDHS